MSAMHAVALGAVAWYGLPIQEKREWTDALKRIYPQAYIVSTLSSAYMGLGIYGFFGYMVNFWMVPNGMGFHTIKYFGYKVNF